MMNFDIKRKINTLRDILVGKVPDPKAQVEQITIALIYKFMDDMDLQGVEFGGTRVFFTGEYEKYAFSQIMLAEHSAQDKLNLYAEGMDKMVDNPDLPKLFRDILRNTYIPYRDPDTLNRFLKEIAEFSYDDSEDLGNAFEYLLSIMGSQGDAGQFRTPRHIIDMMVEIVAPQKNETILDPACGTAGFLISAYNYIKKNNVDENGNSTLTPDDRNCMTDSFEGYDISPDMVRLSRVNMYLHGFTTPKIHEYDTLTSLDRWDDNFDVILANPPFMTPKGGINPHKRYRVDAKRAEVLFVDYIAEHLSPTGRAAIIVPEGIVFQSQTAYKNLRKMLVDEGYLYGVVSLPSGVFNPYSGVKTSILLIDRTLAKTKDSILFVKLNNDGYDLGAQRREIKGSEIPNVINLFKDYQAGKDIIDQKNVIIGMKSDISEQEYILVGDRYAKKIDKVSTYPIVKLSDVCEVIAGQSPEGQFYNEDGEGTPFYQGKTEFTNLYLGEPRKWTTMVTKMAYENDIVMSVRAPVGPVNIVKNSVCIGRGLAAIRTSKQILSKYLFYLLDSMQEVIKGNDGAAFASINRKEIENVEIPLPPIRIQEEIVSEIEQYQKIIDGARQVVDNYRPTIKVNPQWEKKSLLSLCELLDSKRIPITSSDRTEGPIPYYGASGIVDYVADYIFDEKLLLVSEDGANLVARVYPIAFSIEGKTWVNNHAHVLKFENYAVQKYVEFYMNQMDISQYVTGAAQPKLSQENMRRIEISMPDVDRCEAIVALLEEELSIVEQNKRLISIFEKKIQDKLSEVWGE